MPGFMAGLIGFYLALHASYAAEFIIYFIGVNIPIVMGLAILVPVIWLVASPHHLRFMETGIAGPYLLMLVWWAVCALLMSYKGYWIPLFEYGIRFHTAPLIFCGLLTGLRQVRTAVVGYGLGYAASLVLCWKYGGIDNAGRFVIPGTSLGNPNDLALNLLSGVAFLTILFVDTSTAKKLFCLLCVLVSLHYALKTGSRSNFLSIGLLLLAVWKIATARVRTIVVMGSLVFGMLLAAVIPKETWLRLTTFQSVSEEEVARQEELGHAVGSTEARKELQRRAIQITLEKPLFGAGPFMFAYALNDRMVDEGFRKGSWQRPHNTYLDISSESGVLGLILYVSCIVWCVRTNYRAVRAVQQQPQLRQALGQSTSLFLAAVLFSFGTLFVSLTYAGHVPFLVGLTAANWLALRDAGAFKPRISPAAGGRFSRASRRPSPPVARAREAL